MREVEATRGKIYECANGPNWGVMGKEEEGKTGTPGPDEGFYNPQRGVFSPADTFILAEASVMARIAKASNEPLDHSGNIDSHPSLCDPQSLSSICKSVSVSARRFASWTALTPPRWEKRLNVSGRGRQPSSTRVSAAPWRLGAKPVSIYAFPPGLNFLGQSADWEYLGIG